jgi:hypothetical protein
MPNRCLRTEHGYQTSACAHQCYSVSNGDLSPFNHTRAREWSTKNLSQERMTQEDNKRGV